MAESLAADVCCTAATTTGTGHPVRVPGPGVTVVSDTAHARLGLAYSEKDAYRSGARRVPTAGYRLSAARGCSVRARMSPVSIRPPEHVGGSA